MNKPHNAKTNPRFAWHIVVLITVICIALASVLLYWVFCANTQRIHWSMKGHYSAGDTDSAHTISFTMEGKAREHRDGSAELSLNITLPEDFRYKIDGEKYYCQANSVTTFPYYVVNGFCYDREEGQDEVLLMAVDIEAGYACFIWPDASEQPLFAFCSQDVTAEVLLTHFQLFLDAYAHEAGTPKVDQTLDATLYCYSFDSRGMRTYASRGYAFLPAEVTEENPVKIEIPLSETSDYQYTEKRKDFLHYTDKNLPYPCFVTYLYSPLTDSYFDITVAVDFEKQYMAFLITGNIIIGVTVAAADPTVTPETIYTHFQEFLEVTGAGDFVFDETPYFGR